MEIDSAIRSDASLFFDVNSSLDVIKRWFTTEGWSIALNSKQILKVLAHTGVVGRVANNSDMFTIAWTYRWD